MTREKAIHELSTIFGFGFYNPRVDEAVNMAIQALEQEPSRATDNWIPVSERLPENDVAVLVSTKWDGINIAYNVNRHWMSVGGEFLTNNEVLAWMPLPEQYKESEE